MRPDVFGIGNALVDVQAAVSDETLSKAMNCGRAPLTGPAAKGGMSLVDREYQRCLLDSLGTADLATVSGGSACNTMIGLSRLDCRSAYAGKVGKDDYGAFFAKDLRAAGVAYEVPPGKKQTGTCVVLVTPDAQRTMFTDLGISIELTPSDLDIDLIGESRWIYIEGYLWDAAGPKEASIQAMEQAKKKGVQVAYTYSDSFCVERALDDFQAFTKEYVDLVFCNEAEARAFTGREDPEAALEAIRDLGTGVALTLGGKGSLLSWNGETRRIAPEKITPVDSTGAGDNYAAGVLAGLCKDLSVEAAGALGSRTAARALMVRGARVPVEAA